MHICGGPWSCLLNILIRKEGGLKIDGSGWVGRSYPPMCPRSGSAGSEATSVQQCFLLSRCHHLKGLSSGEHAEEGRDLKCPLAQARASSLLTCSHQLQNYPVSLKPCMLSDSFACIDSPSPVLSVLYANGSWQAAACLIRAQHAPFAQMQGGTQCVLSPNVFIYSIARNSKRIYICYVACG